MYHVHAYTHRNIHEKPSMGRGQEKKILIFILITLVCLECLIRSECGFVVRCQVHYYVMSIDTFIIHNVEKAYGTIIFYYPVQNLAI